MANKADLSAHDKANPCCHFECRFVGKTTDSRLTYPRLHFNIKIIANNNNYNIQKKVTEFALTFINL